MNNNYIQIQNKTHLVMKPNETILEIDERQMFTTVECTRANEPNRKIYQVSPHQIGETVSRECKMCQGFPKQYSEYEGVKCICNGTGTQYYTILSIQLKQVKSLLTDGDDSQLAFIFNDWNNKTKDWLLIAELEEVRETT